MPELVEQMYCSQQIVIPPKFPYILKRYCKAAIKTQPYDLLRWSFEYFKALAEKRPPPVKLRLEYPVYSTEGGLTRGCLKVLANQMAGQDILPITAVKSAWQGFCLDPEELLRIFCLCEIYLRMDTIPFLHFIAVAAGMLTKSLTHTMILLCETLTKEPDGGSAAIPVHDFLVMYKFLARMDASRDVKYLNGYKEGKKPVEEEEAPEEQVEEQEPETEDSSLDDYWASTSAELQKVDLIDDHVAMTTRLSIKVNLPVLGKIERSPSAERASEIERQNYMRDRKGAPRPNDEVNKALKQLSIQKFGSRAEMGNIPPLEPIKVEAADEEVINEIHAYDEDGNELEIQYYGEPKIVIKLQTEDEDEDEWYEPDKNAAIDEGVKEEGDEVKEVDEKDRVAEFVRSAYEDREERRDKLNELFDDIAAIVDRFRSAHYDLAMVAGRQMSITSGEFIVQQIEREIMDYIDEQIAILPDPDLKKKKAKPEEVDMIRELVEQWLDENMEIIVPELEHVEEEEEVIPDVVVVYAVPGIGPIVPEDIIQEFKEYAKDVSRVQADVFMPRNIRHFLCPPLEKYIEYHYEDPMQKPKSGQKEELTTGGGTIAD